MQTAQIHEKSDLLKDFPTGIRAKIIEVAMHLWKNSAPESTIEYKVEKIRRLARLGADLYDSEIINETIARGKSPKGKPWSDGYKISVVYAYETFLTFVGGTWERPKYTQKTQEPWIPFESMIDQLIARAGKKLGDLYTNSERNWRRAWRSLSN
ncbi:MAG: hypothetical protein NWF14_01880 [Candidatus Bathyarchaeota archaeon]|nr:hypothetical protein [Candidatus Bathyarchaeota archaeon]